MSEMRRRSARLLCGCRCRLSYEADLPRETKKADAPAARWQWSRRLSTLGWYAIGRRKVALRPYASRGLIQILAMIISQIELAVKSSLRFWHTRVTPGRFHKLPRRPPRLQPLHRRREPLRRLPIADEHGDRHPCSAIGHLGADAAQATENVLPGVGGRGIGLVCGPGFGQVVSPYWPCPIKAAISVPYRCSSWSLTQYQAPPNFWTSE